jgi:hypothetical protein
MALAGLFIDDSVVAADLYGLTAVRFLGRHEYDCAVTVLVGVPVDELGEPLTGLVSGGKWVAGKGRLKVRHNAAGAAILVPVLSGVLPSVGRSRCHC